MTLVVLNGLCPSFWNWFVLALSTYCLIVSILPDRIGRRFYIAESRTQTKFACTDAGTKLAWVTPVSPYTIVGSVVVDSWYEFKKDDVTDNLATHLCLTTPALLATVSKGYRFFWVCKNHRRFKKPIPGCKMYKNGKCCVVWTNTLERPKISREDVLDRTLLILNRSKWSNTCVVWND